MVKATAVHPQNFVTLRRLGHKYSMEKRGGGVERSPWGRVAPTSREAVSMALQAHLWVESGWVLAAATLLGRGHRPRCGIESWESEVAGTPGKAADWSQEARLPTPAPSLSYSVSPRKHPLVSRGTIHTYLTESFRGMSEIIHENILRN